MSAVFSSPAPALPFPEFPLRPHRNGQWFKSVWNPRTKKAEQFYFGSWRDDPKGERALHDPVLGWLARREPIKSGCDNVRVQPVSCDLSLGELMSRFLEHKLAKTRAGELSASTLGDYLKEVQAFVAFMKPGTSPGELRPQHFTAYMRELVEKRKLGRHSRKRVRAYVTAFLRFGAQNGWYAMPGTGVDWVAPATDPDSLRQAKARAGVKDYSDRVLTGDEIDKLLARSTPTFKAMILLGVNCGLGPADIGRLRWNMMDLATGRLSFPRPKTGVPRVGYVWKQTRAALLRVGALKQNRLAVERDGEAALVFITRAGLSFYRESEVHADVVVDGKNVKKLIGIKIHKPLLCMFGRMVRELKLRGVTFYRLRHTFKTHAHKARDREAVDLMMGHKDTSVGKIYDHNQIAWSRIRRASRVVRRRLWPKVKPKEGTQSPNPTRESAAAGAEKPAAGKTPPDVSPAPSPAGPPDRFGSNVFGRCPHRRPSTVRFQ
jgi:integrase